MKFDVPGVSQRPDRLFCPYRMDVRKSGDSELATCGFLQRLTDASPTSCTVDRSACEVCTTAFPNSAAQLNPVLPSLLFHACQRELQDATSPRDPQNLQALRHWALQNIERPTGGWRRVHSCDVLMCCSDDGEMAVQAVESILAQRDVEPIVHLVNDGGSGSKTCERYSRHPQVVVHRSRDSLGLFGILHRLIPQFRTAYIAVQDPATVSSPNRLSTLVGLLEDRSGEIAASAIRMGGQVIEPNLERDLGRQRLRPETLVMRRASLADLAHTFDEAAYRDSGLIARAWREGRRILLSSLPLVEYQQGHIVGEAANDRPTTSGFSSDSDWSQFNRHNVRCDVVLPFYSFADFVNEAIESILGQEHAEVVLHLVDDAGECGRQVFERWGSHPSIRMYRNSENIGPFATFNNLADFWETDFVAVQDADDISLPHRLNRSINLLRVTESDICGGCCETFGTDRVVCPTNEESEPRQLVPRPTHKRSSFPSPGVGYFLENPTAVIRRAAFLQLGGFADFGERRRNRTAVDTEFYARAYYSGFRFAMTQHTVLRYRCHPDSATQNLESGWATKARAEAFREASRRIEQYQTGGILDPRTFGALRRFNGVTRRLPSSY